MAKTYIFENITSGEAFENIPGEISAFNADDKYQEIEDALNDYATIDIFAQEVANIQKLNQGVLVLEVGDKKYYSDSFFKVIEREEGEEDYYYIRLYFSDKEHYKTAFNDVVYDVYGDGFLNLPNDRVYSDGLSYYFAGSFYSDVVVGQTYTVSLYYDPDEGAEPAVKDPLDKNIVYEFNLDNYNSINRILNALKTINGENAVDLPGHSVMEQLAANLSVYLDVDFPQTGESDIGKIATMFESLANT